MIADEITALFTKSNAFLRQIMAAYDSEEREDLRAADMAAGLCGFAPKPAACKPESAPFPRNALRKEWGGFA